MTTEFDPSTLVTPREVEDPDVLSTWGGNLLVLSLDRSLPFAAELGLDAELLSKCLPVMRTFVREYERWMRSNEGGDTAPVPPRMSAELTRMLQRVKDDAGDRACSMLRAFMAWSVSTDHGESWRSPWYVLLIRLARRYTPEGLVDVYAIPVHQMERLFAIVTDFADRDSRLDDAFDVADAKTLSGWDAEAYAYYRVEGPELSPIDRLRDRVHERLFKTTWQAILSLLAPEELDQLERWGHAEVFVHMPSARTAQLPPSAKTRP